MASSDSSLGTVAFIGRFKPPHLGGQVLLETLCERAEKVIIAIGSANRYDARNPFTAKESEKMIDAFLRERHSNYTFVHLDDFGHLPQYADGQKWREHVKLSLPAIDHLIAGNEYVYNLLGEDYDIIPGYTLIPSEKRIRLRSSAVRYAMARGEAWEHFVPVQVAAYIHLHDLDGRFRSEFGEEAMRSLTGKDTSAVEDAAEEKAHISGGG